MVVFGLVVGFGGGVVIFNSVEHFVYWWLSLCGLVVYYLVYDFVVCGRCF